MMGRFIVHLYLDAPGSPSQPRIGDDGDDGQRADRKLEPVGIDVRKDEAVVDDADEERPDDGAEDGADAPGQCRPKNFPIPTRTCTVFTPGFGVANPAFEMCM